MSKHTPGPWAITGDNGLTCTVGSLGTPVAKVLCGNSLADARLIAAAPELLEALNTWLAQYSAEEYEDCPEVVQTRAAIAKATGGEA